MANFVTTSRTGMDYALYGDKSHVVAGYIQQQLSAMPVQSTPYYSRMVEDLQSSYNYLMDASVKHHVVSSLRQSGIELDSNFVMELNSFEQLQHANITMQRWVMAEPTTRALYLQQNIDGYSDTYINTSGQDVGEKDYHYQLAMSGVPVEIGDDNTLIRFYPAEDDLREGDRLLSPYEKIAIQHTWERQRQLIADMGFDFTCNSETPVKINFE